MGPEEYRQNIAGGIGEATELVVGLGVVAVIAAVGAGLTVLLLAAWSSGATSIAGLLTLIVRSILGGLSLLPAVVPLGGPLAAPIWWAASQTVGTVTLALGALAWILSVDGGRVGRTRRFWCVPPTDAGNAVSNWWGLQPVREVEDPELAEFFAQLTSAGMRGYRTAPQLRIE